MVLGGVIDLSTSSVLSDDALRLRSVVVVIRWITAWCILVGFLYFFTKDRHILAAGDDDLERDPREEDSAHQSKTPAAFHVDVQVRRAPPSPTLLLLLCPRFFKRQPLPQLCGTAAGGGTDGSGGGCAASWRCHTGAHTGQGEHTASSRARPSEPPHSHFSAVQGLHRCAQPLHECSAAECTRHADTVAARHRH
ncbi:hypothetical protein B484DRAFT_111554 [Ochromonadaceae sp. CCMP2298]|nr:hypothetical protein B484DRAFT_111554 [Ochromonadaceae sp. CCMP2298]